MSEATKNIEACEELQEEIRCFTESLEQMQQSVMDMRETLKQLKIKIIINKAYKEIADEIGQELSKMFSNEQGMLIRAKIAEILMIKTRG